MTDAVYLERTALSRVASVPYSHLSIELGHLYMEDLASGPHYLESHFRHIAPWVATAQAIWAEVRTARSPARVSTCFLVDDYFSQITPPDVVIPQLVAAARDHGLEIDYLARESGCAVADSVPLAAIVMGRLVADPPPNTNGSRPPVTETGWLCNGQRSPSGDTVAAMGPAPTWAPPVQNARHRHSIFMDIELCDDRDGRTWSCPFLAAIWQLLRLGLLRHEGDHVAMPRQIDGQLPDRWESLPAVIQLNPRARPFTAYCTLSILAPRFLPIEHAVRTILSQVAADPAVLAQVRSRAEAEQVELPRELVDRIEYLFAGSSAARR